MEKPRRPVPTCSRCQTKHFNFQSCQAAARMVAVEAQAQAKAREKKVVPVYRNDSAREWKGDRLQNFNKSGNTYWRKKDHWEGKGV